MTFPSLQLEVAFNADPAGKYYDQVINSDPDGYWRFNESSGTTLEDIIGSHDFTTSGSPTLSYAGLLDNDSDTCIDFDGTNDRASQTNTSWPPLSDCTYELIFVTDTVASTKCIFSIDDFELSLWVTSTGKLRVTDAVANLDSTVTLSTATKYHVIIEIDNSRATYTRVWLNSVLVIDAGTDVRGHGASTNWTVGAEYFGSYGSYFNGRVDEVAVYDRLLGEDEIALHYAAITSPVPSYTDILAIAQKRGRSLSWKRGRQSEKDTVEPGVLNANLSNNDRALDPLNAGSTYYPNVQSVKPARLRAVHNSITYNLFSGDVEDWDSNWAQGRDYTTDLTVIEPLASFTEIQVEAFTRGVEKGGARIGALLNKGGFPLADRALDTGIYDLIALTDASGSLKSLLDAAASAEGGYIFCSGDGKVTYHDKDHRKRNAVSLSLSNVAPQPAGTYPFTKALWHVKPARIKNWIKVIKSSDTAVFTKVYDGPSIAKYRRKSQEYSVDLNSSSDIAAYAAQLLKEYAWPLPVVEWVQLDPVMDDNLWPHVLGREIGDRIDVSVQPPGGGSAISMQCIIEGIAHVVEPVEIWKCTWQLSRPQAIVLSDSGSGADNGVKT